MSSCDACGKPIDGFHYGITIAGCGTVGARCCYYDRIRPVAAEAEKAEFYRIRRAAMADAIIDIPDMGAAAQPKPGEDPLAELREHSIRHVPTGPHYNAWHLMLRWAESVERRLAEMRGEGVYER